MNDRTILLLLAGKALEGLLANPTLAETMRPEDYAKTAYEHALRLLAEHDNRTTLPRTAVPLDA